MTEKTEVLYNDTCPICSREVDHYARISAREALPITYSGITNPAVLAAWGITADEAARRFHVRKGGLTYGGIPAFVVLWQDIPQMRWLARFISLPGIFWVACKGYDYVAAPLLFALHRRRQAKN